MKAQTPFSKTPSLGEGIFYLHCKANNLYPDAEVRFDPVRRWRWDFAFPAVMLAIEIHGGTWSRGRHSRGQGFADDTEKFNAGVLAGWRVLVFTTEQVQSGYAIATVLKALETE